MKNFVSVHNLIITLWIVSWAFNFISFNYTNKKTWNVCVDAILISTLDVKRDAINNKRHTRSLFFYKLSKPKEFILAYHQQNKW